MTDRLKILEIIIPLINPNEPEARIVALNYQDGQKVSQGDVIAVIETTKATQEIVAEKDGYFFSANLIAGQTVRAGERLGVITDTPEWQSSALDNIPSGEDIPTSVEGGWNVPTGIRITQPALRLIKEHQIDLNTFPADVLITEKMVQEAIVQKHGYHQEPRFDPRPAILVYGGGGHGKTLIDLLRGLMEYEVIGIVDDGIEQGAEVLGVPVLGGRDRLEQIYAEGVRNAVNAVGGIGDIKSRVKIFDLLHDSGFVCPPLIHRTALLEGSARLSGGVQILAQSYIGSSAQIGYGVIVNTSAVISHDCRIGNYSVISPGALIAGGVEIGNEVLIGMGVTVNLGVRIGDGARIGNGATIKGDVPAAGIVRAGTIWPG